MGINATTPPETDPTPPPEREVVVDPEEFDELPPSRPAAMAQSALRDRTPGFLLGTIAIAVIVSLIAGFAIGYKVENSRGTGTAKKAAASKKPKHPRKPHHAFTLKAAPLLVGGTYGVTAKQLVVLDSKAKPVRIGIGPRTKIAVAEAGKASDIVVGLKVLFQPSTSSKTKATEIVVLPPKALLGAAVTAVVPGTSLTIKDLAGKDTVITTTGATVEKTRPGTRRNIAKGDHVIVYYYLVRNKRNAAIQVVVLPAGTKFKQPTTTK